MTFLYSGCGKRRWTSTTMVWVILAAMTLPSRSLRCPRCAAGTSACFISGCVVASGIAPLRRLEAELRNSGFQTGDVPAQQAQAARLLQLAAGLLQTQIKYLLPQVPALGGQFLRG